jgi:UPF0755 protein
MARGDETLDDDLGLAWEEETAAPGAPKTRHFRRQRRERRKRRSRAYLAIGLSVALLAVLGMGVYWGIGALQDNQRIREIVAADYDATEMGGDVEFTVQPGDVGTTIAGGLLDAGVVKSRAAFVDVCQAQESECLSIQPGQYTLQQHSPADVVFGILIDPKNRKPINGAKRFTIPEGMTVIEILDKLAKDTGIPLADFKAAAADPAALGITADWYSRQDGKKSAVAERKSIEGFLFPSTYDYDPTWSAHDILKMMVDQFFVVADHVHLKAQATALHISPYEVLITASLVQAEGHEADFAKIARVAYNRVYKRLISCACLQFDSTANYWQELKAGKPRTPGNLTAAQLNDASNPYNTYAKTPGMPLGPIDNPADGNMLYFVVIKPDGTTAFADTIDQHCANIAEGIRNGVDLSPCP